MVSAPKTANADPSWLFASPSTSTTNFSSATRLYAPLEVRPLLTKVSPSPPETQPLTPGHDIPVTYVPFRNAHFLSVAVSWAEVLGAEKVYIGAVEQDSSGYPDCRPAYYEAFNQVIKAGTKDGTIEIVTPLIHLRKAEIVRLGLELGAPFHLTWSCYSRQDQACGVCDSCLLRLRAFAAAGAVDPIPYATMGQIV